MSKPSDIEHIVSVDQLQPGVFIHLEGGWFDHPFLFSKFKLKNWDQINTLKKLGVEKVAYIPERSDRLPLRAGEAELERRKSPQPPQPVEKDPAVQFLWKLKQDRIEKLKEKHKNLLRCQRAYDEAIGRVPEIMQGIFVGTEEAVVRAGDMVHEMVRTFLGDTDAIVSLLSIKAKEETIYYHSLNVAVMALMLGKKMGLDTTEMHCLGMAALLHDIGKMRIEKKILRKKELSKAEREIVQLHPQYGGEVVSKASGFPSESTEAILQHHERIDGSGYPKGLEGKSMRRPARILAIADTYENLCNPPDISQAMTPYQALAIMYTKLQNQLDMEIFSLFIHCLGIYPPGTFVKLSNGALGMVISVNPANPLKPSLMLYDPAVPRDQALIFDMEDDQDVTVSGNLELSKVPKEVLEYLNPGVRITYYPETVMPKG